MNDFERFGGVILNKAVTQNWRIKEYSYQSTERPDFGLLYIQSGRIRFRFENEVLSASKGDIIYLPKGTNYLAEFAIEDGQVSDLLINFDSLSDTPLFDHTKPTVIVSDCNFLLLSSFKAVIAGFEKNDHPLIVQSRLYKALYDLVYFIGEKKNPEYISEAVQILSEEFEVSIKEVCRRVGKSRSVLQKEFGAVYGMSPVQFKNRKRIETAVRLLQSTDMPINEISDRLGFYDTAHFYKAFEMYTGVSPAKLREGVFMVL